MSSVLAPVRVAASATLSASATGTTAPDSTGTTTPDSPQAATPVAAPTSSVATTSTASATLPPASTVSTSDTTTTTTTSSESLETTPLAPVSQTFVPSATSPLPPTSATTSSTLTSTLNSISTPSPPTTDTATTAAQTQIQTTTQLVSTSVTQSPSPNVNLAASSDTPFFQNTAAVAGVFSAVGVLLILVFIYCITRCVRSRRRRLLDRELAISFAPDNLHGHANADGATHRRMPSVESAKSSYDGHSGYAGTSYYTQPPVTHQEQYNHGFPQFDYASNGYYAGADAGPGMAAVGPAPPARRPEPALLGGPQMAQAQQYSAAPRGYMSNYTTPPASGESNIPLSPPLPNPHGEQHDGSRVLKVANE